MRVSCSLALAALLSSSAARADNAIVPDLPAQTRSSGGASASSPGGPTSLHLAVILNGRDVKAIAEVFRGADGIFSVRRSELREAGLVPPAGPEDALVRLDSLPGFAFHYDEAKQTIYFDASEALLATHVYSATAPDGPVEKATTAYGGLLNYDAFARSAAWSQAHPIAFGGGSVALDGRAFSPFGSLSSSGLFGTTISQSQTALRLDTNYTYFDEDRRMTYRAGDFVNSGLSWTRPIRMGGIQISHDYSMRPDLVTAPMANVSGSAAVPSSVDVYMNNFKIFSQDVDPGPYRIENLPIVGANGNATLVLHDINGNETTQSVPFFSSARLLTPSRWDYSLEAGYARTYYGAESFSYDRRPIASASSRYGLSDWATVEAHAEGGAGLVNGGAGLVLSAFQRGVVEAALAGSDYQQNRGLQVALGGATVIGALTVDVSSQRTFGPYGDLAQVTTPNSAQFGATSATPVGFGAAGLYISPYLLSTSLAPAKALDRITLGLPYFLNLASLDLTFVNEVQADGERSRIADVSLSHSFANGASIFASAYVDAIHRKDAGIFFGLSWTFDNDVIANSQGAFQAGSGSVETQIGKTMHEDVGSYGWRVDDNEGQNRFTDANAAYVTPVGKASASVGQFGRGADGASGSVEFTGSIATLGGAVKLAPVIPDSFALVDAGAPGVSVLEDNRVVGKTDPWGQLILTGLRGFESNKISIDPTTLPLSAQAGLTESNLRPTARNGVVADFKVLTDPRDADVILVDAEGTPFPPGGSVALPGKAPTVIGYDGRAYLVGLDPHDEVTVRSAGKTCLAQFDYQIAKDSPRPTIGPITCRPETETPQ